MKVLENSVQDIFSAGGGRVRSRARVRLSNDEMITLKIAGPGEYDVTVKDWGIYATPSLGKRLPAHGLHPALVARGNDLFLMLVEDGKRGLFNQEMERSDLKLVGWLDGPQPPELQVTEAR